MRKFMVSGTFRALDNILPAPEGVRVTFTHVPGETPDAALDVVREAFKRLNIINVHVYARATANLPAYSQPHML